MNFVLFLVLNAVLLIRPEELFPDIAGLQLYLIVILLCVLSSIRQIIAQLTPAELANRPITICVLGFWVAGILSHVVRSHPGLATEFAGKFGKVVVYYLLLVGVIDTPSRLRTFLGSLVFFVVILTTLGLLQLNGDIDIKALEPIERKEYKDPETGKDIIFYQLCSCGNFNDPNDLCLILTTGILCCLARIVTIPSLVAKAGWLFPIALFGYAILETKSRGGLLGLLAGLYALAFVRIGPLRGTLLAMIVLPALLLSVGGRQTEINVSGNDTVQSRLQLWAEGFALLWGNPITGIGTDQFIEKLPNVAHNSFVHAYVETGIIGGTFFLGAFFFAVMGVWGVSRYPAFLDGSEHLRALRPFIFAIVVGYAGGVFSLSRNDVIPTYMILGLATAYIRLSLPDTPVEYRMNSKRVRQLVGVGIAGLVFLKVFTQVFVRYGG